MPHTIAHSPRHRPSTPPLLRARSFPLLRASSLYGFRFALGRSGGYRALLDRPVALCCYAYWYLKLIWLKFVVIWRTFRLWAAADGVDAPENLPACISRQYTLSGFWRRSQDGQSGRLGEAMAGLHRLISLPLNIWGCPPHS